MSPPLISIITITYNSEEYLEQTILSVLGQTYRNVEYIVVDGSSQDTTVEIIERYSDQITYWISEPDYGIADAMNKGISMASGDFILFLHSDDYLIDENVLDKAARYLTEGNDVVLFSLYYEDKGTLTLTRPRGMGMWTNLKTGILHQSAFCSRNLFDDIGRFDTRFKVAMDYDFFLRAYRARIRQKLVDFPLTVMRRTGISSQEDWKNLRMRFSEEREIHYKNSARLWMPPIYGLYWMLYLPYRRVRYAARGFLR